MAITQNTFTGNGSNLGPFSFTFKWLEPTDIKVTVGGVLKTAGTHYNLQSLNYTTKDGGQVLFTAGNAPANNATIRVYRDTDDSALSATFFSGSAIRAQDLNDDFTQNLYVTQEVNNNAVNIDGSNPMVGDLNMGGYKITNLATPVAGTDAANRSFVEGVFSSEVPVFYRRWSKTAAGGATSLSGNDDNGIALSYVPGSEKVFINGALQVRGVDYSGTTGSTLTGIPALIAGDIVEVHSSSSYTVGTVPDGSVTNAKVDGGAAIQSTKLAFIQSGSGATTRTVAAKLADVVSVKDFGAVGDGVADDTAAVSAAIASQRSLDWGGLTYKIVSSITQTVTQPVIWYGNGASVIYNGSHVEYAIRLIDTAGVKFVINDITLDGSKLCNKVFEVLNNTSLTTPSNFTGNNLYVKRAKRLNTFSGGNGINVVGSFTQVVLNGGGASDCELPTGQGTSGVIGIAGIGVTFYSTTSYVKKMVVNNVIIDKVYSSNLAYGHDQDGIQYFVPNDPSGTHKVPSEFVCDSSTFTNCYGRSIKTQCRNTIVRNSRFERTEGLTSGVGNGEIDAQVGPAFYQGCIFSYSNGQNPGTCVAAGSDSTYGKPGLTTKDCEVYLDTGTTLARFAEVFPRSGFFSRHQITNCKVFGKVQIFFNFLCNGDKNYAEVSNCYVDEITTGVTSEKALVYVIASGASSPFKGFVTAFGNVYGNSGFPSLVRESIPDVGANAGLSAWSNVGFLNDPSGGETAVLQSNQISRIGRIGSSFLDYVRSGYFEVITKVITSGATETFAIKNIDGGCLLFAGVRYNNDAYALISSSSSSNLSISVGSAFAVGNTTNPGTGTFRIWSSAFNQISIQNTDASGRVVSVFVLSS